MEPTAGLEPTKTTGGEDGIFGKGKTDFDFDDESTFTKRKSEAALTSPLLFRSACFNVSSEASGNMNASFSIFCFKSFESAIPTSEKEFRWREE